ncbi:hypothetical protein GH714_026601 [Hevea brasiliensis]|uniref:Uncharacterized protein n=1 Tax=Hevea brasiliensis TaxID=3981 RepID=A0A6A6M415_HEVBR|nr:hypothetical protein GH714_026601 [Hevea brasiliensis]
MISTVVAFMGFLVLVFRKPFYHQRKSGEIPLIRISQVIVLAIKNRRLSLPANVDELYEINDKETLSPEEKIAHTNQFRKITGHPLGIMQLQRVGSGLVLSAISMAVAERVTPSKKGWLHGDDIDENNLNLFYWFSAILSYINFANYLFWALWYKYKANKVDSKLDTRSTDGLLLLANKVENNITESFVKTEVKENNNTEEKEVKTTEAEAEAPTSEQLKDAKENQQIDQ